MGEERHLGEAIGKTANPEKQRDLTLELPENLRINFRQLVLVVQIQDFLLQRFGVIAALCTNEAQKKAPTSALAEAGAV